MRSLLIARALAIVVVLADVAGILVIARLVLGGH